MLILKTYQLISYLEIISLYYFILILKFVPQYENIPKEYPSCVVIHIGSLRPLQKFEICHSVFKVIENPSEDDCHRNGLDVHS